MTSDAKQLRQQSYVSKLTLTNFRNYAGLSLAFGPGAVVLSGDNGAGKTNLLEAISLLTPGRGLRRAPYADVAREGGDGGFAVHARIEGPEGQVEIGTGISGSDGAGASIPTRVAARSSRRRIGHQSPTSAVAAPSAQPLRSDIARVSSA